MHILLYTAEISLKGKNRVFFITQLMRNLKRIGIKPIRYLGGKILCKGENLEQLKLFPGIANFSIPVLVKTEKERIYKEAKKILEEKKWNSFKLEVKRAWKGFPLTSIQLARDLGRRLENETGIRADLVNPEGRIWIEIEKDYSFLYTERFKGIGGLPVGTSGKVVSLLSGGIDSPVASFLLMKRGAKVIFLHFYTDATLTGKEKAEKLIKKLSEINLDTIAYFVNVTEVAKQMKKVEEKYRMLISRRLFMRIACEIAKKENALAIATGESLGQVASQTLENLFVIHSASSLPVLTPLIGMNKEEIIEIAKRIGTYDISIERSEDVCVRLAGRSPVTKGKIEIAEREEKKINLLYKIERKEFCL